MNDFKLLIGRGDTFQDCTNLVVRASVTGRRGDAPRTFGATLSDSEGHDRAKANCSEGQTVLFYLSGDEMFQGLLMTEGRSDKRTLTIKAYDNCIYLCNSKDSFSYKKKTATYIFKDCLKKLGLTLGAAVNTGHVIGELIKKNTTYWDVIQDALSQTYKATGVRYYVYSSKGENIPEKARGTILYADVGIGFKYFELYSKPVDLQYQNETDPYHIEGKEKGSAVNSALEKKIGRFSEMENVDEDITSTEIKQRIKTFNLEKSVVQNELKVSASGDIRCLSGSCVYVMIPQVSTKRIMFIEEDTHTFENGHHKMDLKLSYENTITAAGGSNSISSGKKYKVTAKSGLNLRTGPNSAIIATMPHGVTVTSDGKKNGNWIHVSYNGKWGYAYQSWLKAV